jgi:predicted transcriptional regulator
MAKRGSLGGRELQVLAYVAEHAPVSVGEVAEHFAETQGLARTTLLTVLERLREKGYLTRKKVEGVYRYSPRVTREALLRSLVRDFAQRVLRGSAQPFVAYLVEDATLSDQDIAELKRLVEELEEKRKGERP